MTDKATTNPANQRVSDHDEPVPRLPRGKLLKLTGPQVFRIAFFAVLLVGVLMLRKPCSEGIGKFVESFDTVDAGPTETEAGAMGDPGSQAGSEPGAPSRPGPGNRPDDPRASGSPSSVDGFYRITGDMSEEEIRETLRKAGVQVDDAGPLDGPPGSPADPETTTTQP